LAKLQTAVGPEITPGVAGGVPPLLLKATNAAALVTHALDAATEIVPEVTPNP
jgi:hypothetical protein